MYDFVDRPIDQLGNSGRFLLWAMRKWTDAAMRSACPAVLLSQGFTAVGALPALPDFHFAMATLNRRARGQMLLAPMRCGLIGEDEAVMIALWQAAAADRAAQLRASLTLIVHGDAVPAIERTMGRACDRLFDAGFDLSSLAQDMLKEVK